MSGEISKPETARHFIARSTDGSVIHVGRTGPEQVTTTGLDVLENLADDQELLAAASTWATNFPSLPAEGEPVEAGQLYRYGDGVVLVRQSHTRTEHPPNDVPALFSVVREGDGLLEWVANEPVMTGDKRTYGGLTYACTSPHTTQDDWQPDITPALWSVVPTTDEWAPGVSYSVNDEAIYQGTTYRCRQAHTAIVGWEPPNVPALWEPA